MGIGSGGTVWRRRMVLPLLAWASLYGAIGTGRAGAAYELPEHINEFCSREKPANDFGFSRLPPVTTLPPDGHLPFAPPSVWITYDGGSGAVLTKPEPFGYTLSRKTYDGPVFLDWNVTAKLWRLNASGRSRKQVGSAAIYVGALERGTSHRIGLIPPPRRGFYRFDLHFASAAGAPLGSYSQYIKLTRPQPRIQLGMDKLEYQPGEWAAMRVENLGTGQVRFGETYVVERLVRDGWVPAPALTPDYVLEWASGAGPGGIGRCIPLRFPDDAKPGVYRVVKPVFRGEGFYGPQLDLTAEFRIG